MGVAISASSVVRYRVDVRYWECPLLEVPLYSLGLRSSQWQLRHAAVWAESFIPEKMLPWRHMKHAASSIEVMSWWNFTEHISWSKYASSQFTLFCCKLLSQAVLFCSQPLMLEIEHSCGSSLLCCFCGQLLQLKSTHALALWPSEVVVVLSLWTASQAPSGDYLCMHSILVALLILAFYFYLLFLLASRAGLAIILHLCSPSGSVFLISSVYSQSFILELLLQGEVDRGGGEGA